jgi:hypothetical protein
VPSRYVVEVDGGWSTDLCGRGERGIMELRTASSSNTLDQIKGGEHGDHHHLVAAAIVVNGDSGHRVVMCVSDARDAQDTDIATDDLPAARAGQGAAGGLAGGPKEGAEQPSWASHVQFHPQTVAGVPAKGIAKLMAPVRAFRSFPLAAFLRGILGKSP